MDDRRTVWLVVLGALAFVVAVVALFVAIDAKDKAESDADLASSVRAEIVKQVPQLQTALSAQSRSLTKGLRRAARARAQLKASEAVDRGDIKRLSSQIKTVQGDVNTLSGDVKSLTNEVNLVKNSENRTRNTVANLTSRVNRLQAELDKKKNK